MRMGARLNPGERPGAAAADKTQFACRSGHYFDLKSHFALPSHPPNQLPLGQAQSFFGASAKAATLVGKDSFVWQKGQELIRSYVKSSGFRSDFCAKCGSPVPNIVGKSDYMWIPAGLLENLGNLEIVAHLFLRSKAAWEPRPQKGELFETGPGLEQVYQLLHKM